MLRKTFTKPFFILFFVIFSFSSEATTYYVSNSGNDNNSGTSTSSPWQTISKVNSFKKFAPGDNILFNRGNTFYGSIIVSNSGSSGNPITFGAYGSGANPIITGFTNVTSWTNKGGNIWESNSTVSTLSYCNMVSINGVNTPMGRYPNSGYLTYQSFSGSTSITSSSLTGSPNWTGADVAVKINRWAVDRATIKSQSGGKLNFTSLEGGAGINNFGFFIENDIRTLDAQDEWYYNPSTKKIDVYSTSQPVNVRVAGIDNVINLAVSGLSYVTFDNLTIQGANNILIFNSSGNNISVTDCNLSYCGTDGIQMGGSYSNISNNTIADCGNSGINLFYGSPGNHIVKNNTIKRTGLITGVIANDYSGGGIKCTSANSLIQYNNIDSSGYCGINFRGINVQVRNNFINHSALTRDDAGAIYTGFAGETGKIIDGNIVLNTKGTSSGTNKPSNYTLAQGIYVDDDGTSVTISNNTVANGNNSGIKIHNSSNITIKNNTLYNNGVGSVSSSRGQIEFQHNNASNSNIRNILLNSNIFFADSSTQLAFLYSTILDLNDMKSFGTADNNYYVNASNQNNISQILAGTQYYNYSLINWKSSIGIDAHSLGAPVSISNLNDLSFQYNATSSSKTISLNANYIDVKGKSYNGSITLAPYTSAVLIRNGPLTSNKPPIANAGDDRTIQLPKNSIVFSGSGIDGDGTIASYQWIKISGPSSGTIVNSTSAQAGVIDLVQGVYQFQLTVTDNNGATGTAIVTITVNSANSTQNLISNISPIANAGDDRTIQLPKNSIVLVGSGSDADGTIVSYLWTKISGPSSGKIVNSTSAQAGVNDLVQGVYQFQLTVTDNNGATGTSTVTITIVNSSNIPPIANAGYDRTIQLPKNSIVLAGSGSDADGTIVSYLWTKISGPSSGTIINSTSAQAGVNNLVQGVYQFKLIVTDNNGATGTSAVTVTVTSSNISPVANAGDNRTIQLPKNSIVLAGSGSDADGTIVSYLWTKISGPSSGTILDPTSSQSGFGYLVQGVYQLQLTVTDNQGATASSTMQVTVLNANQSRLMAQNNEDSSSRSDSVASGQNTSMNSNAVIENNSGASQNIEPHSSVGLKVFPNPFKNILNITISGDAGSYQLILLDASGRILLNEKGAKNVGSIQLTENSSQLSDGIYFLKVIQNNKQSTIKLIRQ